MYENFETHRFTYERTTLSWVLFATAIPAWITSSMAAVFVFGGAGVPMAFFIFFAIIGVYGNMVIPELSKSSGIARLYNNRLEMLLHNDTHGIYYENLRFVEYSPTYSKHRRPYILIVGKNGRLKLQMVDKYSYLDTTTAKYESLFHAIRARMNWDFKQQVSKDIFSETVTYRTVPYLDVVATIEID